MLQGCLPAPGLAQAPHPTGQPPILLQTRQSRLLGGFCFLAILGKKSTPERMVQRHPSNWSTLVPGGSMALSSWSDDSTDLASGWI